jgi:hypothetical protein
MIFKGPHLDALAIHRLFDEALPQALAPFRLRAGGPDRETVKRLGWREERALALIGVQGGKDSLFPVLRARVLEFDRRLERRYRKPIYNISRADHEKHAV